jgi:serine/threonine protein phosphatase 1
VGSGFLKGEKVSDATYYAIGDVHGEADRLAALYEQIFKEIDTHRRPACIVHLGDLIDRGPNSRACIALAMALHAAATPDLKVVTLRGNHEQMLLDAVDEPSNASVVQHWLRNGGTKALASYALANNALDGEWHEAIDNAHIAFLRDLPNLAFDEERGLAFVHAGIDPAQFPHCKEDIRLWTRSARFFNTDAWPDRAELEGLLVVHGHTPTQSSTPDVTSRRINVDTGAVFGGPLTAVVLAPGAEPRFLQA